ncbi:L,D-transpeptidase [Geobacillus sp. BMUD]|uniref:L,D-transpeptidase n=1 Tax=Geobacillus TaxID=129337 RepID=UPI0004DEE3BF|nr:MULTISPECIES: L,D-transpeptidase [Geobacillus]NNU84407.1 L,D-transpeptidase [Geobacillus sp. BMUD]
MRIWLVICLAMAVVFAAPFQAAAEAKPLVIVNKALNQLALVRDGRIEAVYPVATGVNAELTPEGLFTVTVKAKNPYYRKKNIPGGAPNNPLGTRWIGFNARGTDGRIYGIHGTNNPASIGGYVSQGCVRMHNRHVEQLYERVSIGANVLILRSNESFYAIAKRYGAVE